MSQINNGGRSQTAENPQTEAFIQRTADGGRTEEIYAEVCVINETLTQCDCHIRSLYTFCSCLIAFVHKKDLSSAKKNGRNSCFSGALTHH